MTLLLLVSSLASVIPTNKAGGDNPKAKSKANLADLVGALNTLRKAAMGRTKNSKPDETSSTTKMATEKSTGVSSRSSTEGQVSLTPITLEERDTPPPPPVELSPLRELWSIMCCISQLSLSSDRKILKVLWIFLKCLLSASNRPNYLIYFMWNDMKVQCKKSLKRKCLILWSYEIKPFPFMSVWWFTCTIIV